MDQVHAALLARMLGPQAHLAGPPAMMPPPTSTPTGNGHGLTPLEAVQSVIQDTHDLMRILPDPGMVNIVASCLKALTGVQKQLMTTQGRSTP